ncbi:MAG: YciI family protein [Acidimicrobiales bacterium]
MPQYILLIYNPTEQDAAWRRGATGEEGGASQEEMAKEQQRWATFMQDLKAAGALVDNRGLQGTDAATTVRVRDGETQITDGPFAETKEVLASYFLIQADDLDTALKYAARVPSAEHGSVEVRPVWG